jgi:hypothetical protein
LNGRQDGFLPHIPDHPDVFWKGVSMKKFVAFVMILSLGVFCAVGCNKADTKKAKDNKAPVETKAGAETAAPKAVEEPKAPEAAKPEEKAPAEKAPAEKK